MNGKTAESGWVGCLDEYKQGRTRRDIENQLANSDEAVDDIGDLFVPIGAWRAQARQVATALGRKVRTGIGLDEERLWTRLFPGPVVTKYANGFRLFTNPSMVNMGEDEGPWTDEGAYSWSSGMGGIAVPDHPSRRKWLEMRDVLLCRRVGQALDERRERRIQRFGNI